MIFKNIEIHNVAELTDGDNGGVRWLRVPREVYDAMESDGGKNMSRGSTGVELRFVMNGDRAVIKIKPLSTKGVVNINVFFGGLQGGWNCMGEGSVLCGESDIVIERPANMDMMKRMSADAGYGWSAEVVRVICKGIFEILDVEGDIRPPRKEELPEKTLLTYGSSITHGSNSITPCCTWASVLAHSLNADLINLGMAGSCRMEPELIDYIASMGEKEVWDAAILELGINVLPWNAEQIRERVTNTLCQVAGRNPNKRIYVMSPLFCHEDYKGGMNTKKWRDCIWTIVKETAYPNVEYINGLDVLGDVSGLSADEVHPNVYGIQQISTKLKERIRKI